MNSRFDFRLWGCIFLFWNLYIRSWGKKKEKGKREREREGERVQSVASIPCISSVFCPLSAEGRDGLIHSIWLKSGK